MVGGGLNLVRNSCLKLYLHNTLHLLGLQSGHVERFLQQSIRSKVPLQDIIQRWGLISDTIIK